MTMDTKEQKSTTTAGCERPIIYQLFPRIFTNTCPDPVAWGSLQRNGSGKLADIDSTLITSLKDLGVNTLWLTGVIEHATKTDFTGYGIASDNPNVVKGEAGSPYAIRDYYDVDPAIARDVPSRMREFEECVERVHAGEMKLIIDFVPNHTARRYHSDAAPEGIKDFGADDRTDVFFEPGNNYYYFPGQAFAPDFPIDREGNGPYEEIPAKATGDDCFSPTCGRNNWYETVKLNYGHNPHDNSDRFYPVPDTWHKMLDILMFWAGKGVDGFRCDMAFMVPLEFWHWVIPKVKEAHPGIIFIGEIYDVGLYRPFLEYGGFDYLYDKVNLYDTLVGIERLGYPAAKITGCWQTVDGIGHRMLNFLENHDEVRYGSPEFASDPRRVVPDLVTSAMISNGPFMIYYGQELGECARDNEGFAGDNNRSTIFDYWSYSSMRRWYDGGKCHDVKLNVHERWLRTVYSRVLHLCNDLPAFRSGDFYDLMYANLQNPGLDPSRQFAFVRYDGSSAYLVVANFADKGVDMSVNIPPEAFDAIGLDECDMAETDMLRHRTCRYTVARGESVAVSLQSRDALILPLPMRHR